MSEEAAALGSSASPMDTAPAAQDVKQEPAPAPEPADGKRRRSGRQRKSVQQLEYEVRETAGHEYEGGSGTELGDLDSVRTFISKADNDDIRVLHKVLFGKPGKKTVRKRQIRDFSGYGADERPEIRKRLERLTSKELRFILKTLDLKQETEKGKMVEKLVVFLESPSQDAILGTKNPTFAKRKRGKAKKRKSSSSGQKRTPSSFMLYSGSVRAEIKAANPELKMTDIAKLIGERWRGLGDAEKQQWKDKADALKAAAPRVAKKAKKSRRREAPVDDDDTDSDEDAPLVAGESIQDKLKKAIKEIMSSTDLSELSIKKIKNQLKEDFGEEAVAENKSMIKAFIRENIPSQ